MATVTWKVSGGPSIHAIADALVEPKVLVRSPNHRQSILLFRDLHIKVNEPYGDILSIKVNGMDFLGEIHSRKGGELQYLFEVRGSFSVEESLANNYPDIFEGLLGKEILFEMRYTPHNRGGTLEFKGSKKQRDSLSHIP